MVKKENKSITYIQYDPKILLVISPVGRDLGVVSRIFFTKSNIYSLLKKLGRRKNIEEKYILGKIAAW